MRASRDLTGNPQAMRALAHPTRLAVLELLACEGPLTATEAGRHLGESPGTMSWHLRLLARHGFVAEGRGVAGRRRPWTLTAAGTRWDPELTTPDERRAADALLAAVIERSIGQLRAWLATRYAAPRRWQRAAALSDWTLYLTVDEAQSVREQIHAVFGQFADRTTDPRRRPKAAIPVRAFLAIHPDRPFGTPAPE
jgi:DNA-binding transcriptional ArsR family regulator